MNSSAASVSRLPPAQRCANCQRVVTPTMRTAIMAEGRLMVERRLCTACQRHVTDTAFKEWAPWIGPPPVAS